MTNFSPRDEIGVYRIIRLLGEGGMGTVYEVEHVKLGVHYALKTFSLAGNDHVDDHTFLPRTRLSASVTRLGTCYIRRYKLHHPCTVDEYFPRDRISVYNFLVYASW